MRNNPSIAQQCNFPIEDGYMTDIVENVDGILTYKDKATINRITNDENIRISYIEKFERLPNGNLSRDLSEQMFKELVKMYERYKEEYYISDRIINDMANVFHNGPPKSMDEDTINQVLGRISNHNIDNGKGIFDDMFKIFVFCVRYSRINETQDGVTGPRDKLDDIYTQFVNPIGGRECINNEVTPDVISKNIKECIKKIIITAEKHEDSQIFYMEYKERGRRVGDNKNQVKEFIENRRRKNISNFFITILQSLKENINKQELKKFKRTQNRLFSLCIGKNIKKNFFSNLIKNTSVRGTDHGYEKLLLVYPIICYICNLHDILPSQFLYIMQYYNDVITDKNHIFSKFNIVGAYYFFRLGVGPRDNEKFSRFIGYFSKELRRHIYNHLKTATHNLSTSAYTSSNTELTTKKIQEIIQKISNSKNDILTFRLNDLLGSDIIDFRKRISSIGRKEKHFIYGIFCMIFIKTLTMFLINYNEIINLLGISSHLVRLAIMALSNFVFQTMNSDEKTYINYYFESKRGNNFNSSDIISVTIFNFRDFVLRYHSDVSFDKEQFREKDHKSKEILDNTIIRLSVNEFGYINEIYDIRYMKDEDSIIIPIKEIKIDKLTDTTIFSYTNDEIIERCKGPNPNVESIHHCKVKLDGLMENFSVYYFPFDFFDREELIMKSIHAENLNEIYRYLIGDSHNNISEEEFIFNTMVIFYKRNPIMAIDFLASYSGNPELNEESIRINVSITIDRILTRKEIPKFTGGILESIVSKFFNKYIRDIFNDFKTISVIIDHLDTDPSHPFKCTQQLEKILYGNDYDRRKELKYKYLYRRIYKIICSIYRVNNHDGNTYYEIEEDTSNEIEYNNEGLIDIEKLIDNISRLIHTKSGNIFLDSVVRYNFIEPISFSFMMLDEFVLSFLNKSLFEEGVVNGYVSVEDIPIGKKMQKTITVPIVYNFDDIGTPVYEYDIATLPK